jgi:hypothetical protein
MKKAEKYTKFNTPFRQAVVNIAEEIGLEFISTKRQVENGSLLFYDPQTGCKYGLYESGYIRRFIRTGTYPLNSRSPRTVEYRNWRTNTQSTYYNKQAYDFANANEQLGIFVRSVFSYRKTLNGFSYHQNYNKQKLLTMNC